MSTPTAGYQATAVRHLITSTTVQGYAVELKVNLVMDPQYVEEIAQLAEDAAAGIKTAVEAAHPTWTILADRTYYGEHYTSPV